MSQPSRNAVNRIGIRRLRSASRMSMRPLTLESLERRCPLDASAMAGGFGSLAMLSNSDLGETLSIPALTCINEAATVGQQANQLLGADADTREPQSGNDADVPLWPQNDPWPIDDPFTSDGRCPGAPDEEPGEPFSGTDEPPRTATEQPQPNELEEPSSPINIGEVDFRPDPVRVAPPPGPSGSIALDSQHHDLWASTLARGLRPKHSPTAPQVEAAGDDSEPRQSYQRSSVSLTKTRYYESSEQPGGEPVGTRHVAAALRALARQRLPQEAGIAIGSADRVDVPSDVQARNLAHTKSASHVADSESLAEHLPPAIDPSQADTALVALVDGWPEVDSLVASEIRTSEIRTGIGAAAEFAPQQEQHERGRSCGHTCGGEDGAADSRWQVHELVADLSRWAAFGLLVTHRLSLRHVISERLVDRRQLLPRALRRIEK